MPAIPGNEAAYEQALTMRAYHRDAEKTARVVIIVFGTVFAVDGHLWIQTGAVPFAFGALFGLALLLLGIWFNIHHGAKVTKWQAAVDLMDSRRRDTAIHILPAGTITGDKINFDAGAFKLGNRHYREM